MTAAGGRPAPLSPEDQGFARRLAGLLGADLEEARRLTGDVLYVRLSDGRQLAAKGVARQSAATWRPGEPWAELVALDALGAEGAPVPKLVAADLEHGWLAMEFADGSDLARARRLPAPGAFAALAGGLERLHRAFARAWDALAPWAVEGPAREREWAAGLLPFLDEEGRAAWQDLAAEALERPEAVPGPLDVQAANVVWQGEQVTFLDMASFGYDGKEKRLAAYAQRAGPEPVSLLDAEAYAYYRRAMGRKAALRLAFFDFLYWGMALARVFAAARHPGSAAARRLEEAWGPPQALVAPLAAMWRRPRLDDLRVERVRRGLVTWKEGASGPAGK